MKGEKRGRIKFGNKIKKGKLTHKKEGNLGAKAPDICIKQQELEESI